MKYLVLALMLIATPVFAQTTELSLSGTRTAGISTVVNGSAQYDTKSDIWQEHLIGDFMYHDVYGKPSITDANIGAKIDYKINDLSYLQSGIRGEYNNSRPTAPASGTYEIGGGYKVFHTDNIKLSEEFGVGVHVNEVSSSPVLSNSIWLTWKLLPQVELSDRYLIEQGLDKRYLKKDTYTTNDIKVKYRLTTNMFVTLENKYKTETQVHYNTSLIGISLRF